MSLQTWLFDTRGPAGKYILRMAVVSFVPSVAVAFFLGAIGVATEERLPRFDAPVHAAVLFVGIVVFSPIVETLLMALLLGGLSYLMHSRIGLALSSAIIWALFHSAAAAAWGLVVLWPFFVFSCAYLAWRGQSRWKGIWVAASIHMLHNLLPALLILALMRTTYWLEQ
jgi:membrane protease YdiL (CAAX protease family)